MMRIVAFSFLILYSCSTTSENKESDNQINSIKTDFHDGTLNLSDDDSLSHVKKKQQDDYFVKAIKTESGWGYQIYQGSKLVINQLNIPAVQGNQSFKNESDAFRVGDFVLNKIRQKQFPPTITIEELKNLGVN